MIQASWHCRVGLAVMFASIILAAALPAQDQPEGQGAKEQFDAKFNEWKDLLKSLRDVKLRFKTAKADEADGLQKQWTDLLAKGEAILPELQAAGVKAFAASPNTDRDLTRFLVKLLADQVARDDYEPAYELGKALLDAKCGIKEVFNNTGIAAFCTNRFDDAESYLKEADSLNVLSTEGRKFNDLVSEYKKIWAAEQESRTKEAEADDLPRVKMSTSQGDVVIELFENEAPGAVGNFVSLVEKKFYDGLTFHRVLKGFMAQGGDPQGTGSGGPGYNIKCECYQENHRKHFRGSLSMAHAGRDTGGSQFFLTFVPTEHLNGRHTVFGRVIEGFEVLAKLQRRDPTGTGPEPDKIVKAEVLRKRPNTTYAPNKAD